VTKCANKETNSCLVVQDIHLRVKLLAAIQKMFGEVLVIDSPPRIVVIRIDAH